MKKIKYKASIIILISGAGEVVGDENRTMTD